MNNLSIETDQKIIEFLAEYSFGNFTRNQIAKFTKLPRSTVFDSLERLQRIGLVEMMEETRPTRGRRRRFYFLSGV
jgi:DNA-binding IclR family transcriptional regulator